MTSVELLRSGNTLNPTILDTQGRVWRSGHGFTEFAYRGVSTRGDGYAFVIILLLSVSIASATGWLGG